MDREEIMKELNIVWDRLDFVLNKLWNEVAGENREYKINSLIRKRERLIREEHKLMKKLSKYNKNKRA